MKINIGKNDICYTCQQGRQIECDAGIDDVFIDDIGYICDCKCYSKRKKQTSSFKKPTADEINAYCAEKGYSNVDADAFISYYNSCGWKIGKTLKPMTSWKGAVANWSRQQAQYDDEKRKKENKGRLQSKPTYDLSEYEKFAMSNTEI